MLSLHALDHATQGEFIGLLDGIYEHSPWVAEQAWHARPFASLAALKLALVEAVRTAGPEDQLALLRAHPQLAGKVMADRALTPSSAHEQTRAGLADCTPQQSQQLQQLNQAYADKFGFPFILAVLGPRGTGLAPQQVIDTFERRLGNPADFELQECLRNVHRIAELRLNARFGITPERGNQVWDWAETLAGHSDQEGALTVTYLTPAHRACSRQIAQWMRDCGFDDVGVDAVGNVVGLYHADAPGGKRLLTGSHFDTVRNGGRYDGRLGILVPMACVRELHRKGTRLPYGIEVVAFAEEEGQRFHASFLASSALIGRFDRRWLDQLDAEGITMRRAMQEAGLAVDAIDSLARDPGRYLGFVEVHIEQGPVLNELDLPLAVVTSINGGIRIHCEVTGLASHAGTTPMDRRRDAALGVAELALHVERRAASVPDVVGTVGMLEVPNGSVNVVPGRCRFSLDLRATTDAARDALAADVLAELERICQRRRLSFTADETMRTAAAPSAPEWQRRWERAVASLGLPVMRMASGAGHDAMRLHAVMPQAMLFLRGGNSGISHNPLETITSDDAELCVQAFQALLAQLARE